MASRYRSLAVYSLLLAAGTGVWLVQELIQAPDVPSIWVILFGIVASLFVWQFGVPAPRVGLISMERVPQLGLLLVFGPPVAAAICAAASFLWPLLNPSYSQRSSRVAGLRALHNAAMTALMLLLAGGTYRVLGGRYPLDSLGFADIWPLVGTAVVAQVVNISVMSVFFRLDGRDVRAVMTPVYAFSDLIFVPAAVLAALLYNTSGAYTFALFVGVMLVFVLSFNSIGVAVRTAETERGPMARLFETPRALRGARRLDELGERILSETRALFGFDEFYLALVERDRQVLHLRVHERSGDRMPAREKALDAGLFGWVVDRAQPLLVEDWSRAPEDLRTRAESTGKRTGSVLIVPLVEDGAVIGVLSVQHTDPRVYSEADLHLMEQLAAQVAAAVADARTFEDLESYRKRLEERVAERTQELEKASGEKERLIAALRERSVKLERESQEDALTGVANRRGFTQRLGAEMEVSLAVGQPLTLAVADVDHFKVINDRLGHTVGDKALSEISRLMKQRCRQTDMVARIGGEEFALILPGMPHAAGIDFCESLRASIESHDWTSVHPELSVTLSIGLCQWDGSADVNELLEAADVRLYRAKRAGRNQVA